MTSEFETQIDRNDDGSEQRRGLRGKPRRTARASALTLNGLHAAAVLAQMQEQSGSKTYQPLTQDETLVTAQAISGAGVLQCDPANARFFAGHDILVVVWGEDKTPSHIERHTVNQVLSGSLDIVGTVSTDIPKGASIYPCVVSDVSLSQQGSLLHDQSMEFGIEVREFVASTTLPALVSPGSLPSGAPSYKGLPILAIPHHWQTTGEGVNRQGRTSEVGLGTVTSLGSDSSAFTGQLSFLQESREEAFELLRFFDSRAGSCYPFWYPLKSKAFTLTGKSSITLSVTSAGSLAGMTANNKILAIWLKDGTVLIRFIVGVAGLGASGTITLNETVSASLSDIDKVSFACLARFNSDSISENWRNLQVMETSLDIQGLPFSGDIACTGTCCESGNCQCDPEDCDTPEPPPEPEPPDQPWEPGLRCLNGTANVPMYYDLHETWNSGREPIRAADLNLPDTLVVTVKSSMTLNESHPEAPDALSPELEAILFQAHELAYAGTLSRTAKSRNPYHYRVAGTVPTLSYSANSGGEEVEDSPYWEVEYDYKINEGEEGEEDHTLTIRMYAEWVDQSSATGGDSSYGAWGAMFVVWAWSSEHDDYVDGTPYAAFEDIEFTKSDPFVGGLYEGEGSSEKFVHPSALFLAMCPTTWHFPLGYSYHSMLDREQFLHECYAVSPGAPWSTGSASSAVNNAVFGDSSGGYRMRALGALGGWTTSEFFEWLCAESGMTILNPSRPGWDEENAVLTVGSADITIDCCTPSQSANAIHPAEGHPSDYVGGVGGTHEAWRSNAPVGDSKWIALGTSEVTTVTVTEQCVTITTTYDEDCQAEDQTCSASEVVTVFRDVVPEDYSFAFGSSQSGRTITFKEYVDNPDYVRRNWPSIECQTEDNYWVDEIGSSSVSLSDCETEPVGDITCTPTSGNNVNLMIAFDSSGDEPEDGTLSYTVTPSATDKIGIGFRTSTSLGGDIDTGYLGILDVPNRKLILYIVTGADTISIIKEAGIPAGVPLVPTELKMQAKGSRITFTAAGLGTVSTDNCVWQSGGTPAIVSLTSDEFDALSVSLSDDNWKKIEVTGTVTGTDTINASVSSSTICRGYLRGNCDQCIPENCPGDDPFGEDCNGPCTSVCKFILGVYSVTSGDYPGSTADPHGIEWHPPTDVGACDEESCAPPEPPCGDCPAPFEALDWSFGGNYASSVVPAPNESEWIGGLSEWYWAELVCD